MVAERKPATDDAKVNRRINRRLAKLANRLKEERRLRHERAVTIRQAVRASRRGQPFSLLQVDARYWQLKACGWDVLLTYQGEFVWSVDAQGKQCDDPEECTVWQWWRGLHPRQRAAVWDLSFADQRQRDREKAYGTVNFTDMIELKTRR